MLINVLGYIFVIASAIATGWSEGMIVGMRMKYKTSTLAPVLGIFLLGDLAYMVGLTILGDRFEKVLGVWEVAAVSLAVIVAVNELKSKTGINEISIEVILGIVGIIMSLAFLVYFTGQVLNHLGG